MLFVHTGHANFLFNPCSIFKECCFQFFVFSFDFPCSHWKGEFPTFPFYTIWNILACFTFQKVHLIVGNGLLYPRGSTRFEFQRIKYSQEYSLKKLLVTLLSKILCGCVTLFQVEKHCLVYQINVRERLGCNLTPQTYSNYEGVVEL